MTSRSACIARSQPISGFRLAKCGSTTLTELDAYLSAVSFLQEWREYHGPFPATTGRGDSGNLSAALNNKRKRFLRNSSRGLVGLRLLRRGHHTSCRFPLRSIACLESWCQGCRVYTMKRRPRRVPRKVGVLDWLVCVSQTQCQCRGRFSAEVPGRTVWCLIIAVRWFL
jgi:hypothetical protein